jgi:hypothetical protein
VVTSAMPKAQRSPRFVILFVTVLLALSALIFWTFRAYQRAQAEARSAASVTNLSQLKEAIDHWRNDKSGRYPTHVSELLEHAPLNLNLTHPSWPDQPGYVYVTGVQATDAPDSIVIFENVPERKRKLGYHVLRLNGKVDWLSREDFSQAIQAQEERWRASSRIWRPEEIARGVK